MNSGREKIADLLIKNGADFNFADTVTVKCHNSEKTPLHWAARNGNSYRSND